MQHVFWLVENELCGRPGPNHEPWQPEEFLEAGIGAILSVNEAESVYLDELKRAGIEHKCVPLAANAPPRTGELELCSERLPIAYDFSLRQIQSGHSVLVHCRQGKDRTGLFMAYYLKRRFIMDTESAINRVMAVRPIALSAEGWDEFAIEVLEACSI